MDLDNLTYPDGYSKPPKPQVEVFYTWVWYNSELCNECFTQVRSIGSEVEVGGPIQTQTVNAHYERTEDGLQAHTAFEKPTDRFGTTFCSRCGSDLKAYREKWSKDQLIDRTKNIIEYFNGGDEPPYTIDGKVMGRAIDEFKSVMDNQGYDTEIIAVATIYGIFNDNPSGP